MDKIAVCAIFKDEAPYLLEWLAFHKMIGVDLFVLYDNGSTDGGGDLIRESNFARNVTLIEWSDRPGQISAYRHFHANYAKDFHLGRVHRPGRVHHAGQRQLDPRHPAAQNLSSHTPLSC